jgi:DNA-binding beta-propeller fold protein YncE
MQLHRLVLFSFGLSLLAFGQPASAPKLGADAPTMGYKEVPEWPTQALNAAGTPGGPWNFIQVSGVTLDAQGHILVLHRGARPIMEFESNGKFVRSWGDGMFSEGKVGAIAPADRVPGHTLYSAIYGPAGCDSCGAHSIRVDPEHNIWAVDAPGHVIYKMNPQGKNVAFAPNGDFYISDGYAGNRVVKFSHDRHYLLEWGTRGAGPGQFELPHGVVVDAEGKVYVSDRETHRIEVFDSNGHFLTQWPALEGISALFMTRD